MVNQETCAPLNLLAIVSRIEWKRGFLVQYDTF